MISRRVCAAWSAMALCAAAVPAQAGGYRAPRNAWGAPELGGLWSNTSLTTLERQAEFKSLTITEAEAKAFEAQRGAKAPGSRDSVGGNDSEWWEMGAGLARIRGLPRTSWIVSPADGKRPYTASARAAIKERAQRYSMAPDGPEAR